MTESIRYWKKSVLAAKIETAPGTAISVSASDAVFNVYNLDIQPNINMTRRPGQGSFGRRAAVQEAQSGTIKFLCDAIGGASAPAWMSTFLPACGWVDSAGTFSPKTLVPGASVKTLTMAGYQDGRLKKISGAMGKWSIELVPGSAGMFAFEFQGIWIAPTDASILTPTYETVIPPRFGAATLSLGAFVPRISKASFDCGNELYLRPDATTESGYAYCIVQDRMPKFSIDPESDLIANRDTYGIWKALTTAALTCTWGSSGNQISIAAPAAQVVNVQEGNRGGLSIDSVDFECLKSADAGDDELTIAYA